MNLTPLIPTSGKGLYVAVGPPVLPAWVLAALCPALAQGLEVLWIDAGNAFAAISLALAARDMGADPKLVLSRVKLARPFTAFQLEAMVCGKLPAAVAAGAGADQGLRSASAPAARPPLVVLSDPLALFSDSELSPPPREARPVFNRVLAGLTRLQTSLLALAIPRRMPAGCADLPGRLERAAKAVTRLDAAEDGRLLLK